MKNNLLNEQISRIKSIMGLQEQTNPAFKTYSKLTFKLDELPAGITNYNPSIGYIRIDGGNEWLATNRANSLKNLLLTQFKGSIEDNDITVNETKVLGSGDTNQYVIGTFYGKMKKVPEKQEKYPYTILYNFYDINGVPHILVTEPGKGTPQKLDSTGDKNDRWVDDFNKFLSKIPSEYEAKIVSQTIGGGDVSGSNKQETLYGIMIPITQEKFGYTARGKGMVHFDDKGGQKFKDMANFIADYTDNDFRTDESLKNPNATQHNFTSSAGGGGNYGFGDLGTGRSAKLVSTNNPNGDEIVIKRMESSKEGIVPGDEIKRKDGGWFDLGSYKLDSNFFKDNMISIKPETYKVLFDGIINLIKQKGIDNYKLVELKAKISGYASSDNATNRLPEGTTKPDHTYGNRVPIDRWVQRD